MKRSMGAVVVFSLLFLGGLFLMYVLNLLQLGNPDTMMDNLMYVFVYIWIYALACMVLFSFAKRYSEIVVDFSIPTALITSLFLVYEISRQGELSVEKNKTEKSQIQQQLSFFTERVVVDGWEKNAQNIPSINAFYASIFSAPAGGEGAFLNEQQWNARFPDIPYVPFIGHEHEWHYAAQFIQQMVNVVRMFDMQKRFPLGSDEHLQNSLSGKFSGWITSFRMFFQAPLTRNVWEMYKYRHVNPEFTAWVQFYVIDPVHKDPHFWQKHYASWDAEVDRLLHARVSKAIATAPPTRST